MQVNKVIAQFHKKHSSRIIESAMGVGCNSGQNRSRTGGFGSYNQEAKHLYFFENLGTAGSQQSAHRPIDSLCFLLQGLALSEFAKESKMLCLLAISTS